MPSRMLVLIFGYVLMSPVVMAVTPDVILLDLSAQIYPQDQFPKECMSILEGKTCNQPEFGQFHVISKANGLNSIHHYSTFSDTGAIQVTEEAWEENEKIKKVIITNKQLKTTSELEVKEGKVHYKHTLEDGSVKTSVDDWEDHLVVPSTLMTYLRSRFDRLVQGEKIQVKMAVLDRRESYTFNLKKIKDTKMHNGEPLMVVEMTAASIIIKAFVSPIRFYIQPNTGNLIAFEGRSVLRRKEGEKWKEMDVRNIYSYKINAFERKSKNEPKATLHSQNIQ